MAEAFDPHALSSVCFGFAQLRAEHAATADFFDRLLDVLPEKLPACEAQRVATTANSRFVYPSASPISFSRSG